MGKVAIISCDNGLGHLRRCYLLALKFANNDNEVTLFSPLAKFQKFQKLFGVHKNIKNINFSAGSHLADSIFKSMLTLDWIKQLPDLKKYSIVICDNLPEILKVRPDAVLSGHFFWHDVNHNIPSYYADYCNNLIEKCEPIVIGTDFFSSSAVKNCKNYKPTGIYIHGETDFDQQNKDSILITGGSTSIIQVKLTRIFEDIINDKRFNSYKIYVDQKLLNNSKIISNINLYMDMKNAEAVSKKYQNIYMAEYNKFMYKKIDIALCRPGVGTLSDLLQHGCYPICFYEFENKEMQDNISSMKKLGLCSGLDILTSTDTLLDRMETISAQKSNFLKKLSDQNFDGADTTYNILIK
jgi:hypothetical protein